MWLVLSGLFVTLTMALLSSMRDVLRARKEADRNGYLTSLATAVLAVIGTLIAAASVIHNNNEEREQRQILQSLGLGAGQSVSPTLRLNFAPVEHPDEWSSAPAEQVAWLRSRLVALKGGKLRALGIMPYAERHALFPDSEVNLPPPISDEILAKPDGLQARIGEIVLPPVGGFFRTMLRVLQDGTVSQLTAQASPYTQAGQTLLAGKFDDNGGFVLELSSTGENPAERPSASQIYTDVWRFYQNDVTPLSVIEYGATPMSVDASRFQSMRGEIIWSLGDIALCVPIRGRSIGSQGQALDYSWAYNGLPRMISPLTIKSGAKSQIEKMDCARQLTVRGN